MIINEHNYLTLAKYEQNNKVFYKLEVEGMHFKNYVRDSICSKHVIENDVFLLKLSDPIGLYSIDIYKIIPNDTYQLILNEKLILGIEHSTEADFRLIDIVYDVFVKKLKINPKQLLLIVSSFDFKNYLISYTDNFCKMELYSSFERLLQKKVKHTSFNPLKNNNPKKKFICFNRTFRSHRMCLLKILSKKNLIQLAYYSFPIKSDIKKELDNIDLIFPKLKDQLDNSENIVNILPLTIDTQEILEVNHAWDSQSHLQSFYEESYFSVVTETNFNNDTPRFFTEKIFKPILHKHPFIVLGNPYLLEHLRNLGYKTFNGIIDETYDTVLDESDRLLFVANEIERLCNFTQEELFEFQTKCLEIVEYNYNLFKTKNNFIRNLI